MFAHIFVNRFKCITRDRQMLFWTFLFPIVLCTLFGMAFQNMNKADAFTKIPIAVVDNAAWQNDSALKQALDSVSGPTDKDALFQTRVVTGQQAEDDLKNGKIEGYILPGDPPEVVVRRSGIDQTILKEFVDDTLQIEKTAGNIAAADPAALPKAMAQLSAPANFIKDVSPGGARPNDMLTYYYALIAMTCLYGGFWGLKEVASVQADLTAQGARVNMGPVHKLKVFGCSLCAATAVHMISVLLLIAYMALVMKIDFGSQLPYILLAAFAGCCTGVSMGAAIAAAIKKRMGIKISVLIGGSMVMSFFAGLMQADVKYLFTKKFPPMAFLNPGNLIADAFYALYYYTDHTRYLVNIGLLFGFSLAFYLVVYFVMRRQKYESL